MQRDAMMVLRLPKGVKDALGRAADDNMRTLSGMALWAMADWLRKNGYELGGEEPPAVPKTAKKAASGRKTKAGGSHG
jgi:hypothetical protein